MLNVFLISSGVLPARDSTHLSAYPHSYTLNGNTYIHQGAKAKIAFAAGKLHQQEQIVPQCSDVASSTALPTFVKQGESCQQETMRNVRRTLHRGQWSPVGTSRQTNFHMNAAGKTEVQQMMAQALRPHARRLTFDHVGDCLAGQVQQLLGIQVVCSLHSVLTSELTHTIGNQQSNLRQIVV